MHKRDRGDLPPPTDFGPLVEECARRGIGKTTAFKLVREKKLDTFSIGSKRYVYIQSLQTLPERLATQRG